MPVYAYHCDRCGAFDGASSMARATDPAPCPQCAAPGRRAYTAPGGRARSGVLAAANDSDRARIDRARSGEPLRTGSPTGRRVPGGPHVH